LLGINERPAFINLHPLRPEIAEGGILELRTNCTKLHEEFVDCVAGDACDPGGSAHGATVHKAPDDLGAFRSAQLVHIEHLLDNSKMSSIMFKTDDFVERFRRFRY
jgi:hypothetical protein